MTVIRIGTRKSTLAMWQANKVSDLLELNGYKTKIIGISSDGDRSLGGDLSSSVGQFIYSIDTEIISENIDIAVHSSKDVPIKNSEEIKNLAYLKRGSTADILITNCSLIQQNLEDLLNNDKHHNISEVLKYIPKGGMVGTASGRRQSFLLKQRPDIIPIAVRGQIETRLKRLKEGRVDAIILAEIGLERLYSVDALKPWVLKLNALRISENEWPTAPGQGAISIHCKTKNYKKLKSLREVLNDLQTESDVTNEREILSSIGGGCLFPAGIKVTKNKVSVSISPENWRSISCQGLKFKNMVFDGNLKDLKITLPKITPDSDVRITKGPKLISTLNSERLSLVLKNGGINVINQPVLDLISKPDYWPTNFLDYNLSRDKWPVLVLTSPFAAKCAIEVAKENNDLNRIQWLAIGEGTARACFMRGVTVSICAKSRNSSELTDYIIEKIEPKTQLMIPRSDVASLEFTNNLKNLGFDVNTWVGYENKSKQVPPIEIQKNDVLLLSSPSSARAWIENSLPIPKNILCMGKASREEIGSLELFANSKIETLQGPTAEFIKKWWKNNRGD